MHRRNKLSWLFTAALVGAVAHFASACGDTDGGSSDAAGSAGTAGTASGGTSTASGGTGCTPGKTEACVCTNGDSGAQTCKADGTGFDDCECGGGENCGNSTIDMGEECDDGNQNSGDGCDANCKKEGDCPNGIPDPGECGPEGTCLEDCLCGNGKEDVTECGIDGTCPQDCCLPENTQIFAGFVPSSGPDWQHLGDIGTAAGNAMCQAQFGADHFCTYEEIELAAAQNELMAVPVGTTAWLHRTTTVMVNGNPSPAAAGGRCNDWKYKTNHISDGEYLVMEAAGKPTYFFDNDTVFNQNDPPGSHTIPGQLECGGATRAIFCCYAECKKPL